MDQRRRFPWLWILATLVVVVVVGAIAYWLGMNHGAGQPVGFVRPFRPFAGPALLGWRGLGWWIPLVLLALVVGIIVAAIARPSGRTETFEEWHRRQHEGGPVEPSRMSTASTTGGSSGDQPAQGEAGGRDQPPG